MFHAFNISLPIALGIAASPGPIVALMILLITPRAIPNSYSFLLGWFIGLMLVGTLVLHSPGLNELSGGPTLLSGWIRISLGSSFLLYSLFIAKNIPKKGEAVAPPRWLGKVDSYGFVQALIIGFIFSGPNIKNAAMVAAGAVSIGGAGLSSFQELIVLLLFCLFASLGVLLPHTIFLFFRDSAESVFGKLRVWLLRNRALILMIVLVVFGGLWLYRGIIFVGLLSN